MKFADGYLIGVTDGSNGTAWCDKAGVSAADIKTSVIAELRKLTTTEQQGPAAAAIVHTLRSKYPCK
jgi:hypothetical protein